MRPEESTVELTGAVDHVAHLVPLRLYEAGLRGGEGRYVAACGRVVLVAAMTVRPGRPCPLCRAAARSGRA